MSGLRFFHFSDLHLGVENYGRIDPATGLSTRLGDYLAAFDELIDAAIAERIDFVLFTGDAYKNRDPSPTHQREMAKRIARLTKAGIPIFLVVGNHDLPNSAVRAHSVEIFDTLALDRVHVGSNRPELYRIETASGPVQIVSLPWLLRGPILRLEQNREKTVDELHQMIREFIVAQIESLTSDLDPAIPAILAGHVQVQGATFGSERRSTLGQDYVVAVSDLRPEAFDYVGLGHIHAHQALRQQPPVVYAGSLQRTDFGEEHETKGYVRVEMVPAADQTGSRPFRAEYQFVPIKAARAFLTIRVDARAASDPTAMVLAEIERRSEQVSGTIVRLQIMLTAENESRVQDNEIRRALGGAFYVAAVARLVERPDRRRLPDLFAEQLSPHDALERYWITRDVTEVRRNVLLEHADRLIAEQG